MTTASSSGHQRLLLVLLQQQFKLSISLLSCILLIYLKKNFHYRCLLKGKSAKIINFCNDTSIFFLAYYTMPSRHNFYLSLLAFILISYLIEYAYFKQGLKKSVYICTWMPSATSHLVLFTLSVVVLIIFKNKPSIFNPLSWIPKRHKIYFSNKT